uniref:Uncharacterized protein n=1 Tax=Acrobeloides nanus TaxID=290746 RepID=A0A914C7T3_9BILA
MSEPIRQDDRGIFESIADKISNATEIAKEVIFGRNQGHELDAIIAVPEEESVSENLRERRNSYENALAENSTF